MDELDRGVPQTARTWNYWLGGTDNFAVDRQAGDQIDGLTLTEPGVTSAPLWRPSEQDPQPLDVVYGVAKK